jgi:DNA segregation ATPase FtsK/SpoIIIE, S-DNA-T family
MPRPLTVSEVRHALYWAAGGPAGAGAGEPTLALLGRLFHETYVALTGADPALNLVRPLEQSDASLDAWKRQLVRHSYAWHVAPALEQHHAALQSTTREVLDYWTAVRRLAEWLAQVMWAQAPAQGALEHVRAAVFSGSEQEISVELRDKSWDDSVAVTGRLDALLRQPSTGDACVVELKTGRTAPEADLCQAALYRLLLAEEGQAVPELAVMAFGPERVEHRFKAAQLVEAETKLRALVGRLAGVARTHGRTPRPRAARVAAQSPAAPSDGGSARRRLSEGLLAGFAEFGIRVKLEPDPLVGPTFIRFFAHPDRGVRVRDVEALPRDLWARLALDQPPQIAIGRGHITIDVQRPDRQDVLWGRDVQPHLPGAGGACTRFPVGVDVEGRLCWADLAEPEHSHFLVAGTSGSGKSEWLRAILASLLVSNTPETLRLVLIDPKQTAFPAFSTTRFLRRPVVYPDTDALPVLEDLIAELERRLPLLADAGVQDLRTYESAGGRGLPRIVCVCDEYADLVLARERRARQRLETAVSRLAAMGRAAGIHLVFATQRPSADVVRGPILANFMARVALRVASAINSRLVVERAGAEALLGKGDLLFKALGDPVRLQSPYATEEDLRGVLGPR